MNNALKGALLSGLVLPGVGQLALKQKKSGIALIVIVLASLIVIITKALQQAFAILEKIEVEGSAIDMSAITNAASQAATSSDGTVMSIAFLIIIACWVFGVVDAYRIGKKKDQERSTR